MLSGTAIKAVVLYVSDYITKSTLKTHTIFDTIKSVFKKNSELINVTLPMKEKARQLMTKIVNLLGVKMEMGAPMICMYLLDNPDHYTDHHFVTFYWQSFINEARKEFLSDDDKAKEPTKVILIKRRGAIVGLSPVFDYIYRSEELTNVSLYDWISQYKRVKIAKKKLKAKNINDYISECDENSIYSNESEDSIKNHIEENDEQESEIETGKNIYQFLKPHPLYQSHAMKFIIKHEKIVPNFIGPTIPRFDQGDRNYYCSVMLALFKPW
jgi:hypothetical protein